MSKKALIVGIDEYPGSPLSGCVNDARAVASLLERNADGTKNFDIRCMLNNVSKDNLNEQTQELFKYNDDIALFYFSGHGSRYEKKEYICTPDGTKSFPGLKLLDILQIANESLCKNKIIILDSCFSGGMGDSPFDGNIAELAKGITILSAARANEPSVEIESHGIFTTLLCSALNGGAADLLGNITPGSIYAYIDKALGSWNQRPIFKTNVQEFVSLRNINPPIDLNDLISIKEVFSSSDVIHLDPSFEFTNNPHEKHDYIEPYANDNNVKVMKLLQRLERVGLVEPIDEEHMYFAAMHSKSCQLTPLGKYYKSLSINNRF